MASKEMMRRYLDLITAGEFAAATEYWADDLVGHMSGNNPTSGTYTGKKAWIEWSVAAVAMQDSVRVEEHDLLVSDDHAVVLATMHAERSGKQLSYNRIAVFHTEGEKITEAWLIDDDQEAVDDFLS